MKTKRILYILLALCLGAAILYRITKNAQQGAGGKGGSGGPKGGKNAGAMPPTKVNGLIVSSQAFDSNITLSGAVEADEEVEIRPEIAGLVKGIYFTEGTSVRKGQLLVKINDTELQAQLKQALSKQKLASETESRAKQLLKKEAISQEEYDVAFAELTNLKAQTELIRAQLSKTAITAPFSGRIGLRSISTGEYVSPSTSIAKLVNSQTVKISFSVPEKYAGKIKNQTEIQFTVDGNNKPFSAKIYAMDPGIETNTRTLQLKAKTSNVGNKLVPGSFAKITLPLAGIPDAILIPTQAVIPVLKGKKVFISSNGLAKEIPIETGPRTDKYILVLSGLAVGDTLLTSGMMSLKNESPVKVIVKN